MATKLERISRLALDATLSVASSPDHWKTFLDSAAWLYKYPFRDQVLIHAQKPEATACAEIGMWNERLHRWVNKGAKGIALIDTSDEKPHLRYVFDVSDTNSRQNTPLKLWQQTPTMEARISEELENSFGDLGGVSDLTSAVFGTALNAVTDNQKDYLDALLKELGGSELSGTDGVDVTFQLLLGVSVAYTVLKRLGYDAGIYLTDDDFEPITQFDTIETISRLGEATSDISEMILRQIERSVRQIEKESRDILANENTIGDNAGEKNSERSKSNGTDLHASRERTDPEPGSRSRTDGIDRQVRTDAETVSGEKEGRNTDSARAVGQAHAAPSGDQRSLQGADRSADQKDGTGGGRDGTTQSGRSNGMGTADEQYSQPRRGDRDGGSDLQLIEDVDEEAVEEAFPASLFDTPEQEQQFKRDVKRTKPTMPQMSLFDLQEITPETASTGTLSLRYSQQVIDEALTIGANDKNSRLIICAYFAKDHTPEENAAFLKEHYGTNGAGFYLNDRQYAVWYDADGFRISAGDTVQGGMTMTLSWDEAAKRIRELLDLGRYLPQEELLRVNVYERSTLAELLIFTARDLSEEGREQGLLPSFAELHGSFDDERDQIMSRMDQPESLKALIDEWRTFAEAHKENPDLLRFRFYRPMRLLHQLEDLQREPIRFSVAEDYSPQPSRFISLDEIDKLLRGSDSERGTEQRLETYAFFLAHSDSNEREKHLKGIHGEHHGFLAGNDQGEFTSKGIMFSHGDMSKPYAKIEWNWTKVRQRIETLISQNRFLSEKDRDYMLEYEHKQIARMIVNVFVDAPDTYEHPFSKNPIGDYWECVAEVQKQLTDPARINTILDTLISLEADTLSTDRGYEERHKAVENLTAYRKGEFSLFGEKREPIPVEDVIADDELLSDNPNGSSVLYRPYAVDDTVYLDGTEFRITNVTAMHVELIDPTIRYPIFRTESKANFERLLKEDQRNAMFIPPEQQSQEPAQEEPQTTEFPPATVEQPEAAAAQEEPVKLHSIVIDLRPSWEREFQEPEPIPAAPTVNKRTDFRITDDHLGEGGAKTKFQRNIAAIRTLKAIESEHRLATPDEQAVLSQYVGWGGLPDAFDDSKEQWQSEYAELKELLTDREYESARASTLNAHYTSPVVIRAMYEAIGNMGFQTGNILEPSCGIGNFFGMLPERMRSSKLYGVELDDLTGRIAKQLYQNANVRIEGFEESVYPDSFFDVAIGNVPFGDYSLADKRYDKNHFLIHDYFFAKALDKVRPGGVVAFITSSGTMDKANPAVRKYLAQRAELLGAIRLPNNAFRANAGTDVVADIIFLQKRDHPIEIDEEWLHIGKSELGYPINEYFLKNPDMILGELTEESTRFGMGQTVTPIEGADLSEQLRDAIANIHGEIVALEQEDELEGTAKATLPADPDVRNFSFTIVDGEIYFRENSIMTKIEVSLTAQNRIRGMIALRDCVHKLINLQLNDYSDAAIAETQAELNTLYDAYTAKYGLLNSRGNSMAFSDDSSYPLLCSLEVLDENGKLERKADMFYKRTVRQYTEITHVDTAAESLTVSLSEKAKVDLPYMAGLTGKSEDALEAELTGLVFRDIGTYYEGFYNPDTFDLKAFPLVTADAFLSGNVRSKLNTFCTAQEKLRDAGKAEEAEALSVSIAALEKVQPKDLDASEINVRLGATWIPEEDVKAFIFDTLQPRWRAQRYLNVHYFDITGEW